MRILINIYKIKTKANAPRFEDACELDSGEY